MLPGGPAGAAEGAEGDAEGDAEGGEEGAEGAEAGGDPNGRTLVARRMSIAAGAPSEEVRPASPPPAEAAGDRLFAAVLEQVRSPALSRLL